MVKTIPSMGVATIALLGCACFCIAGHAQESAGQACVVFAEGTQSETSEVYFSALKIESRKAGGAWMWRLVKGVGACAAKQPALVVSNAQQAVLTLNDADPQTYSLEESDIDARARTLARTVLTDLGRPNVSVAAQPLLDPKDEIGLGGEVRAPMQKEKTKGVQWLARVGGTYLYQMPAAQEEEPLVLSHMMGPQLEVGAAFFKERLVLSLMGAYRLGQTEFSEEVSDSAWRGWEDEEDRADLERLSDACERGDREACADLEELEESRDKQLSYMEKTVLDVRTGEIIAMARAGQKWGHWKLRGGLGVGWRHQEATMTWTEEALSVDEGDFEPESGTENFTGDSGVAVLDVALIWQLTKRFHLGLFVGGRTYFGQTGSLYDDDDSYQTTPFNLGGQLALGVDL